MKNFIERLEELKTTDQSKFYQGHNFALDRAISIYNELHHSTENPEPNKAENLPSFKVRVTKCRDAKLWYNDKIGEVWEVLEYSYEKYITKNLTNKVNGGYGYIYKSDCEIIPETTVIPFDYDRWKKGDYLRVVTAEGVEVTQLTEFDIENTFPICGVVDKMRYDWTKKGYIRTGGGHYTTSDLHLEIATPKPKEYFVNVYQNDNGTLELGGIFENESVVNAFKKNYEAIKVKTIKFTI